MSKTPKACKAKQEKITTRVNFEFINKDENTVGYISELIEDMFGKLNAFSVTEFKLSHGDY
jgi:hypothetical protein